MRRHRSLLAAREGVAALEFALVGPVFLLLIVVIFEAGLLMWANSAIQETASRTVRCIALGDPDCANRKKYANDRLDYWGVKGIISPESVSVLPGPTCNNAPGQFSTVTIEGTASALLALKALLPSLVLKASACYPKTASETSHTGS